VSDEKVLFNELKKAITETFLQDFPMTTPDMSQWKGLDIIYFQEHLRQKVRGNVSEKWFYTYFKSPFEKLPRVDMLNMLAQYSGFRSWAEFVEKKSSQKKEKNEEIVPIQEEANGQENTEIPVVINSFVSESQENNRESKIMVPESKLAKPAFETSVPKEKKIRHIAVSRLVYWSIGGVLALIGIFLGTYYYENKNTCDFCFYDADRGSLIQANLDITIIKKGFSPEFYSIKEGCFSYRSTADILTMVVTSPIYKKDTFVVGLKEIRDNSKKNKINFKLRPDDYAIMLKYYSTLNTQDELRKAELIKQRRAELDKLIADNALIYQVYDNDIFGVEVLDKKKYIDFMTTPTTSLKNYVLISSTTDKYNKINFIKFKIQKDES
jgi:hypothetical protein